MSLYPTDPPEDTEQWPLDPCPECGAIDPLDCQCDDSEEEDSEIADYARVMAESEAQSDALVAAQNAARAAKEPDIDEYDLGDYDA